MDQIIRNLSFEVVTVPQDVTPTSTCYTTPIKVKIKMKKGDKGTPRQGIITIPKVRPTYPEKTRTVRSDETIMSFDIHMEPELHGKPRRKSQNRFFHLLKTGKCLDAQIEDDDIPYMLASSIKSNEIKSERSLLKLNENVKYKPKKSYNKGSKQISKPPPIVFGTCKPGGCLDPPFGEDSYQYHPSVHLKQGLKESDSKDSQNLCNESPNEVKEANKNSSTAVSTTDNCTKEASSTFMLYEANFKRTSLTKEYSDSIITYPARTSSGNVCTTEKNEMSRKSSLVRNRQLNTDTYFTPTKTRKSFEKKQKVENKDLKNDFKDTINCNLRSSSINTPAYKRLSTLLQNSTGKESSVPNLQETVPRLDLKLLDLVEISENTLLNVNNIKESIASFKGESDELKRKSEINEISEMGNTYCVSTEFLIPKLENINVEKSILSVDQENIEHAPILELIPTTNEIIVGTGQLYKTTHKIDNVQKLSHIELNNESPKVFLDEDDTEIIINSSHKEIIIEGKQQLNQLYDTEPNLQSEEQMDYVEKTKHTGHTLDTAYSMNEIKPSSVSNLTMENLTHIGKSYENIYKYSSEFIEVNSDQSRKIPEAIPINGIDEIEYKSTTSLTDNDKVKLTEKNSTLKFSHTSNVFNPIVPIIADLISKETSKEDIFKRDRANTPEKIKVIENYKDSLETATKVATFTDRNNVLTDEVLSNTSSHLIMYNAPLEKTNIETTQESFIEGSKVFKDESVLYDLPHLSPLNVALEEQTFTKSKRETSVERNYVIRNESLSNNLTRGNSSSTINRSHTHSHSVNDNLSLNIAKKSNNNVQSHTTMSVKSMPEIDNNINLEQHTEKERYFSHVNINNNISPQNVITSLTENTFGLRTSSNNRMGSYINLVDNKKIPISNSDVKSSMINNRDKISVKKHTEREEFYRNEIVPNYSDVKNDISLFPQGILTNISLSSDSVRYVTSNKVVHKLENEAGIKNRDISQSKTYEAVKEIKNGNNNAKQLLRDKNLLSYSSNQTNNITGQNMSNIPSVNEPNNLLKTDRYYDMPHYSAKKHLTTQSDELPFKINDKEAIVLDGMKTNSVKSITSNMDITGKEELSDFQQTMPNITYYNNDFTKIPSVGEQRDADMKKNSDEQDVEWIPINGTIAKKIKTSYQHVPEKTIVADLGFQTFVNEDAETILKTFDTSQEPIRLSEDRVFVIRSRLKLNDSKLSFAINSDTRISIKVDNNRTMNNTDERSFKVVDLKKSVADDVTKRIYRNSKMHISTSEIGTLQKTLSDIYENDLVPIEKLIKGIRLEIDKITKCRHLLKKKSAAKKLKPTYYKRCICSRRWNDYS